MSKKILASLEQKKKALLFFSLLFFSLFTFAQQKATVNGTVYSLDNVPLAGVSVRVKGTNNGTTSDAQGRFRIQVNKGATLVCPLWDTRKRKLKSMMQEMLGPYSWSQQHPL